MLSYSIAQNHETGVTNLVLFLPGELPLQADSSHPSYPAILAGLTANEGKGDETLDYISLFSAERAIATKFARLSDRVTVKNGEVHLDGDKVEGPLEDQIVAFLEKGEDFGPLVNFYEKLLSNPLGSETKDALVAWMKGQGESGGVTITPEGNVLGYKSLNSHPDGFVPSRTSVTGEDAVNDVEVGVGNQIVQNVGDTVSMPRSLVLHAPSAACAEGLHVGTWGYASGFSGDSKFLVEFDPRFVVSVPTYADKIRVSTYTIIAKVDGPLDSPVFGEAVETPEPSLADHPNLEDDSKGELDGARAVDWDGDTGTLSGPDENGYLTFTYDNPAHGSLGLVQAEEIADSQNDDDVAPEGYNFAVLTSSDNSPAARSERRHGKGGRHSKAAEGNGLNPNQDPTTGQFVQGRPGSRRDTTTGRFSA